MRKKELAAAIANQTGLSEKNAALAVQAFIDVVGEELKKGETVTVTINNGQKMEKITTFEYRLYFDSDFFEKQAGLSNRRNNAQQITRVYIKIT